MFKADVGEEGDPFQTSSGTTYVVKVEGIRPPKLKPLSDVRAQATADWQREQVAKILQAKAKELASKATADKSLKGVAASIGVTVQTSGALRRPAPNTPATGPFSNNMLDKIFSVPAGQAVAGPTKDGSYMIARITGVLHPPAALLTGARLRQFARSIAKQAGSDLVAGMTQAARDKEGVSVNQQLVDRLTGESS
jgi:peptidyl-prolyl cis-trans isomerase D